MKHIKIRKTKNCERRGVNLKKKIKKLLKGGNVEKYENMKIMKYVHL